MPFPPLDDDDLGSILLSSLQSLADGPPWDDLHVTSAAVAAGVALSRRTARRDEGARSLDGNALVSAVSDAAGDAAVVPPGGPARGVSSPPAFLRVDADRDGTHAVFSWCREVEDGGAVELVCEEVKRSALG